MSVSAKSIFKGALAPALLILAGVPAIAQQLVPIASVLDPMSAPAGSAALTVVISGGGFQTGARVFWGSQALNSSVLNVSRLSVEVPAQLLVSAGQSPVYIVNPNGARSNPLTFTVLAPALSIAAATLPGAARNTPYSFTFSTAGGSAPYIWSAENLPAGLALNQQGQLTGTPAATGTFTFTVRVSDTAQHTAAQSFSLVVAPPALSITSPDVLSQGTEGVEYAYAFTATGATPPLRWSAGTALPASLALSAEGLLRGIPSARGSYNFTVQLTDGTGTSVNRTVSLTVAAAPLAITTVAPLFAGSTGTFYSQSFAAAGGTPPYAWSLRTPVPSLQLDAGSGVLSGTPSQAGSFPITVTATDAAGVPVSKDFTVVIGNPQLRITNNSPLPSAAVGSVYTQRFLATGGQPPFAWSVGSGELPAGLVLDVVTGILAGTPAASGNFSATVIVRDNTGATASRQFALTVGAGPLQLSADSASLSTTAGEPFSFSVTASGGALPYAWSANGLPEGLEIDPNSGTISGVVRVPGSYLFTVRVTDAARSTMTEIYRLEVAAPSVPDLTLTGLADLSKPADQGAFRIGLAGAYSLPLNGQLSIAFAPDSGTSDPAVQFSTGGRTLNFRIPAGATEPELSLNPVGLQTGSVAGTITVLLRLETPGALLTPSPVVLKTIRVERSAPVITSASFSRSGSTIELQINGYSTTREISQGVVRFRAATGNTLSTSEITLSLDETFGRWFRDTESARFGGQFTWTQQFTVQGDAALVAPASVTVTNRAGSTTYEFR